MDAELTAADNPWGLEPLMDANDSATYLGVPVSTIYGWRTHGLGPPPYRFGKHLKENHKRASARFGTQKKAIARAKEIVENTGRGFGEVRIQGKNGQFRDSGSGSRNETSAKDHR